MRSLVGERIAGTQSLPWWAGSKQGLFWGGLRHALTTATALVSPSSVSSRLQVGRCAGGRRSRQKSLFDRHARHSSLDYRRHWQVLCTAHTHPSGYTNRTTLVLPHFKSLSTILHLTLAFVVAAAAAAVVHVSGDKPFAALLVFLLSLSPKASLANHGLAFALAMALGQPGRGCGQRHHLPDH